jgi:hypothetical protein
MTGLLPFPPHTALEALQVLFLLLAGHALMDYPLQGEFLSTCKNRHLLDDRKDPTRPVSIWPICMTAHCLLHAVMVWAVTGCFVLCLVEFVLHWIIDYAKCENWTTFQQDQWLHILCKIGYVVAAMLV